VRQTPGLNIITEYMIGYIYPGRPVANVCFKTYGYTSMLQAVYFLSDFKLGHYMKIPPCAMFHAQVINQINWKDGFTLVMVIEIHNLEPFSYVACVDKI